MQAKMNIWRVDLLESCVCKLTCEIRKSHIKLVDREGIHAACPDLKHMKHVRIDRDTDMPWNTISIEQVILFLPQVRLLLIYLLIPCMLIARILILTPTCTKLSDAWAGQAYSHLEYCIRTRPALAVQKQWDHILRILDFMCCSQI